MQELINVVGFFPVYVHDFYFILSFIFSMSLEVSIVCACIYV